MFTRNFLETWWQKALRRRVLYTALDREDRGYLYLTMKVLDRVSSAEVGTIIVKILAKLRDALESPFVRKMETYGIQKAMSISAKAVEWGHDLAESWSQDRGFAKYLTVISFDSY